MEGLSDTAYAGKGTDGDETITCNKPLVVIPSVDNGNGPVSEVQNLSNHLTSNASANGALPSNEYLNGIPPLHEVGGYNLQDNCCDTLVGNETNVISKVVSPTIFENAVNVVKNLFSPAKGHGIFSRGTSQATMNELNMNKGLSKDIHSIGGSLVFKLDQMSPTESRDKTFPLTSLENNLNLMEDANNSTIFTSIALSGHDNTNDSYTTTVSIMDESFQSTITHFDENMQNEIGMSNMPVIGVENDLDCSLNKTMETNESSLDNTLKKNLSTFSVVNGDLNKTFDVLKIEDNGKKFNVEFSADNTIEQSSNETFSDTAAAENNQENIEQISLPEECAQSFHVEETFKTETSSSTPNKRNSSDGINSSKQSILNLVSVKFQEPERMNEENLDKLKNCTMEDMDNLKLSPFTGINNSSGTDFSFFPVENEMLFAEKTSTPKSGDIEKNSSTSTIILTKGELERLNFTSTKDKEEGNDLPLKLNEKDNEPEFIDNKCFEKPVIAGCQCVEVSTDITDRINSTCVGKRDGLQVEPESNQLVKNFTPSESVAGDVSNASLKPDVEKVDFSTLNLTNNLQAAQLKPEEETGIPLASQKSYTVLHNLNPDLNRPVVLDYMCDVHAEKLNDIILGNRTFLDLGVFKNCSEEFIVDCPKNACNLFKSKEVSNTGSDKATCEVNDIERKNKDLSTSEVLGAENETKQESGIGEPFPILKSQKTDSVESTAENHQAFDHDANRTTTNIELQNGTPVQAVEMEIPEALQVEKIIPARENSVLTFENTVEGVKQQDIALPKSCVLPISSDGNHSVSSPGILPLQCCNEDGSAPTEIIECVAKENYQILEEPDLIVQNTPSAKTEVSDFQTQIENLTSDLERLKMNDSTKQDSKMNCFENNDMLLKLNESLVSSEECASCESSKNSVKAPGSGSDTELTQFIQEQFTAFDIEKICSVVDDISELNLSKNIVLASQKFDKSFHEKTIIENDSSKSNNFMNDNKFLSSALDFLDSIKGKGSGRDYSRESLYIKFDPLVQSKNSAGLLDISEGDKENMIVSPVSKNVVNTEPLIPITPLKQTVNVSSPLSPLTPVTQKNESMLTTEKLNKLWELQSEITRLRELSMQREELNKEKMNNYEKEIAKLTGRACVLEEKLKESEEMEKSLVRKLNVQNESMSRLKNIVEEYLTYIGKLTDQIEVARMDNQKKTDALTEERDYYMNHLQSTEQAFSDVHSKYEKCKKTVEVYKKNEETYRASIEDLKERIEQYSEKINHVQENAAKEMSRLQEKINDMKLNHAQEISRFKAQLRKTELKVQTIQEALDQKVKENQELARICDELIDGKK